MPGTLSIQYLVADDAASLANRAAQYMVEKIEQAVTARGRARIAISGGSTPKSTFHHLGDPAQRWRARIPWDRIELFWVDERCVPPDHPDSNYRMTCEALLDYAPLNPAQIHRMEGELAPEEGAARYESGLRIAFRLEGAETPIFDLVQLGMGPDGHTASLFPHTAALKELGRLSVANHVLNKDAWRITLTWPVINHARDVFFLIGGAEKAAILREVLLGPREVERLPSQLIHPSSGILTLILDRAAASLLPATDAEGRGNIERIE